MKVKALKVIKNSFVTMANAKTVLTTLTSFESQINGGGVMGGGGRAGGFLMRELFGNFDKIKRKELFVNGIQFYH